MATLSIGDRLGLAGVLLAFLGIAVQYLLPDKRWIGWLGLASALVLICAWACIEAVHFWAKWPLVTTCVVGLVVGSIGAGAFWLLMGKVTAVTLPSIPASPARVAIPPIRRTDSMPVVIEKPARVDLVGALGEMAFSKRPHPRETGLLLYVAVVNHGLPTNLGRYFLEVMLPDGSQPHTHSILVGRTPIPSEWMLHDHDSKTLEAIDRPFTPRDDLLISRLLKKERGDINSHESFVGLLNFTIDAPYEQATTAGTKFYILVEDGSLVRHIIGDHTLRDAATEARESARSRKMMAEAAEEHAAKSAQVDAKHSVVAPSPKETSKPRHVAPPLSVAQPVAIPQPTITYKETTATPRHSVPHAIDLTITTDTPLSNPRGVIVCDGPIDYGDVDIDSGEGGSISSGHGDYPNIWQFTLSHLFTPDTPITVRLESQSVIHVKAARVTEPVPRTLSLSQTMINSPGSIQAGRDVNINSHPQMILTKPQQDLIIASLKSVGAGHKLEIILHLPTDETRAFAVNLAQAFEAANLEVVRQSDSGKPYSQGLVMDAIPDGVSLGVGSTAADATFANIVAESFIAARVARRPVQAFPSNAVDRLIIYVTGRN